MDPLILLALQEDITSEDITTNAVIKAGVRAQVNLIAKEAGIIAGLAVYRGSRRPNPAFWRADCPQLSATDERHRHPHPETSRVFERHQNQIVGHPKNHTEYADFRKICRDGWWWLQPPL
jgi:hypothetical protein